MVIVMKRKILLLSGIAAMAIALSNFPPGSGIRVEAAFVPGGPEVFQSAKVLPDSSNHSPSGSSRGGFLSVRFH
jgi:hypothetical protein